ncbi:phosphoribosylformylglycinamidine cyclo-ligase [Stratiformator vulcanicus]|uniref:Phosphoribosylformylglycinamidine cyclo-ligase n=1 Tax=Stratiformator vulcanicus TaxID=2527980 RepID=A0A517QZS5_9PLAN|nr:phosphoribosylformylglycinamidine cyclo-ligase [Stratiformator vulcanicus]QDT37157.1 Phosphoribosylformylglycinamidine cyclo-ligase [Stratiformator vulcanicus]
MPDSVTYKSAGVDLDVYAESMRRLPELVARTKRPGMMDLPGGFAGLFRLMDAGKFEDPVLVSGTDGVGTKLKVAQACGRFDTVGIDLVAMCVNDVLCLGAEPLFFLDYLAMGRDEPDKVAALVAGVSEGCVRAGCGLIGGETAIMPDVYAGDEFDMAGFSVGVVDRSKLIDGSKIEPGDVVVGLPSSGFHSNGYSLIRKVVFDHAGMSAGDRIDELGRSVGELLIEPTRIYAEEVRNLLASDVGPHVRGLCHITGGGLVENIERILPQGCGLEVEPRPLPPEFEWLRKLGDIADDEMRRVFNCGIGFVFVVPDEFADQIPGGFQVGRIRAK